MKQQEAGQVVDEFLLRALAAGVGVALAAGPMGSFIVWRRMAFFGDTLAHSALFGIALGLVLGVDLTLGILAAAIVVSVLLALAPRRPTLATDTALAIMAHGSLAFGLVMLAFLKDVRVDLFAYLFGDILAVGAGDLLWIYGAGALALVALGVIWRPLLSLTVHADLAQVDGVPVTAVRLAFLMIVAVVVAVSIKIVGVLLVTALLIVPAATARRFARSPEAMAVLAAGIGALSVALGLGGSLAWDIPSGPAIVAAATLLFVASTMWPAGRRISAPR
jgi:zinc transport system permease protein